MSDLERVLSGIPFLEGLADKPIALLAQCASEVQFKAGSRLLREGQPADLFYILTQGSVSIEVQGGARGPLLIQTIDQGEVLGWSWLVNPYVWHFDARAMVATRAIAIDANKLRAHCESNHEFGYEMLRRFVPIVVQRLEAARMQLLDLFRVDS